MNPNTLHDNKHYYPGEPLKDTYMRYNSTKWLHELKQHIRQVQTKKVKGLIPDTKLPNVLDIVTFTKAQLIIAQADKLFLLLKDEPQTRIINYLDIHPSSLFLSLLHIINEKEIKC